MQVAAQVQQQWLNQLLGEWQSECECQMGADQPPLKTQGTEIVRSLGGPWIVAEGSGDTPDGTPAKTMITLGFDSEGDRFVGTFVCSMTSHLWHYEGRLDAAGKVLTLDTEGPNFNQTAMAKYQDIIELVSNDHRIMTSRILGEDGQWTQFMTAHYHRRK
jgi:Protein of unknown function (DUF1579)